MASHTGAMGLSGLAYTMSTLDGLDSLMGLVENQTQDKPRPHTHFDYLEVDGKLSLVAPKDAGRRVALIVGLVNPYLASLRHGSRSTAG